MNALISINGVEPVSLADVNARLSADRSLTPKRRRDLVSSVTSAAHLLDRACADLEADVPRLRAALLLVRPVQRGITKRRFANIKSDLGRALEIAGVISAPPLRPAASPAWADFLAQAEAPHQAWALARFVTFCMAQGVEPEQVSDDVISAFERHLDQRILTKDPGRICKRMIQTWNGLVERRSLDLPRLTGRRAERYVARPLTSYPQSLQDDIADYIARLKCEQLFEEDAPDKPHKAISIRNVEAQLRQYLDALVSSGRDPMSLQSLGDLVALNTIKAGLNHIIRRIGKPAPATARNILAMLIAIGRHHVKLPESDLKKLRSGRLFRGDADGGRAGGMTQKNKARLAQFERPENLAALTTLPERLIKRARQRPGSSRSALDAMYAVAIAILLVFPIRMNNLANLDMARHFVWTVKGKRRLLTIRIPGAEVKNGEPLEVDIREELAMLVWTYVNEFRFRLCTDGTTTLFPKASGGARSPGNLGASISALVLRELGLDVNPHLFRHLAGLRFLMARPGEYEVVRRILGHRKIDTTLNYYTHFENKQALARFDETLSGRTGRGR